MTWRLARDEDVPAIQEFLLRHVQSSMFTLAKLHEGGLSGIKIWMLGKVRGILAVTAEGLVFPEMPGASENEVKLAAELLRNQPVTGIIGEASQSRRLMDQTQWESRPANINEDEPGYTLDMNNLIVPELPGAELVPLEAVERELAVSWRKAYCMDAIGFDADQALAQAKREIEAFLIRKSHRVLLVNGTPVATTGFNAAIPGTVQIGGVYTPPELRGKGYARTALAMDLHQARASGVSRAVLCSASEEASRAYVAIGFERSGSISVVFFKPEMEGAA